MSTISMLTAAFAGGGRSSRYGDYTVIYLQACAFVTTPIEFQQVQSWARGKNSTGMATRDRMLFVDRFENVLARSGSGIATKGNRSVLSRIVKSMKANGMPMDDWSVPLNLDASVEIARRKAEPAPAGAPGADVPLDKPPE